MFDADDVPTQPYLLAAPEPTQVAIALPEFQPVRSNLKASLPSGAHHAYDLFCDSERVHEWLGTVRSSRVIARYHCGRAKRTAYVAVCGRTSMGYTLHYEYDDYNLLVRWVSAPNSHASIRGSAQFQAVDRRVCTMRYKLDLDSDTPIYNRHPASLAIKEFRDFVSRN